MLLAVIAHRGETVGANACSSLLHSDLRGDSRAETKSFSINEFYVLRLNFNRGGQLTQLAVEPKYYYADDHPEWAEPDNFPYLSKAEYDRRVAEVDRIKPKGL